jgi:hypothetical protein
VASVSGAVAERQGEATSETWRSFKRKPIAERYAVEIDELYAAARA